MALPSFSAMFERLLSAAGRHEEAQRIVGDLEARNPDCALIARDAALVSYRARRFDEAARRFHRWAELEPALRDPAAEQAGQAIITIAGAVRRYKSSQRLGLGSPLARLTIEVPDQALRTMLEASTVELRSITRANEITFAEGDEEIAPGLRVSVTR